MHKKLFQKTISNFMPILLSTYSDDTLSFSLDYSVSPDLFEPWKARLTKQFLENVEVKGFRPGKVPEKIALENIDPTKMESTIYEETVMRFFDEARAEVLTILSQDGRIPLDFAASFITGSSPEKTENGKTSFQFRITANLLPIIDLESIKNKITVAEPTEKDLPERITLADFETREKENLLNNINAKRVEVKEKIFTTWPEAFTDLEDLRTQFKTENGMSEFFKNFYDNETANLFASIKQSRIVKFVLDNVPPFALPQTRIDGEVARISKVLQEDVVAKNISLSQVLVASGIPNPKKSEPKNILELSQIVYDYVTNEFKLTWILRGIYEMEVATKPTADIFEKATKQIQQKPTEFGLGEKATESECQNLATDRIIRDAAGNVLMSWVQNEETVKDVEITKNDKKSEDKVKKTEKAEDKVEKAKK